MRIPPCPSVGHNVARDFLNTDDQGVQLYGVESIDRCIGTPYGSDAYRHAIANPLYAQVLSSFIGWASLYS